MRVTSYLGTGSWYYSPNPIGFNGLNCPHVGELSRRFSEWHSDRETRWRGEEREMTVKWVVLMRYFSSHITGYPEMALAAAYAGALFHLLLSSYSLPNYSLSSPFEISPCCFTLIFRKVHFSTSFVVLECQSPFGRSKWVTSSGPSRIHSLFLTLFLSLSLRVIRPNILRNYHCRFLLLFSFYWLIWVSRWCTPGSTSTFLLAFFYHRE